MFSCSLHTAAFKVSVISLPKRELYAFFNLLLLFTYFCLIVCASLYLPFTSDLAYKDKNNKHFPPNFKLEVFLAAAPDLDDPSGIPYTS